MKLRRGYVVVGGFDAATKCRLEYAHGLSEPAPSHERASELEVRPRVATRRRIEGLPKLADGGVVLATRDEKEPANMVV